MSPASLKGHFSECSSRYKLKSLKRVWIIYGPTRKLWFNAAALKLRPNWHCTLFCGSLFMFGFLARHDSLYSSEVSIHVECKTNIKYNTKFLKGKHRTSDLHSGYVRWCRHTHKKKEQFNSSWTLTATFHFHIWSQRSVQSSLTVEFQKATEVGSAWGEEASLSSSLQRYACSKSCARSRGWKWWWGVVFPFFSLKNKTLVIASASCGSLDALTNKKISLLSHAGIPE